jgi:hypothetical protein
MESSDRFIFVPDHHLSLLCSEFRRHFGNRWGNHTGKEWTWAKKFWSPLVSIYNTGSSLWAFSYQSPLVDNQVLEMRQYCRLGSGVCYDTAEFQVRPLSYNSLTALVYTKVKSTGWNSEEVTHSILPHSFLHIVNLNWGPGVGYAYDGRRLGNLELRLDGARDC